MSLVSLKPDLNGGEANGATQRADDEADSLPLVAATEVSAHQHVYQVSAL